MKKIITLAVAFAVWTAHAQCWQTLSAGSGHSVVIQNNGSAWAWGSNASGQLGDGTTINRNYPEMVGNETNWQSLSYGCNYSNTISIKTDGTLWRWAASDSGNAMQQMGADANWATLASGTGFIIALKTDGTLWAWGDNTYGQLGDGTTMTNFTPMQIGTDSWTSIAAGTTHTIGIKTDGTLWAWGNNFHGQLGDGSNTDQIVPVKIGDESDWQQVVAGGYFSVAKKLDGSLWTWGINGEGQLGDNTTNSRNTPGRVGVGKDWQYISAGYNMMAAIKTDGSLWSWGDNTYGQLGIGANYPYSPFPYRVGNQNNWAVIDHGNSHALALKTDGSLWAWGYNNLGQLGDNTNISRNAPVPIMCNALSTEEKQVSAFGIYPNPASETVFFEGYTFDTVMVISSSGQQLLSRQGQVAALDVSALASGLYFIQAEAEGKTYRQKFIKK